MEKTDQSSKRSTLQSTIERLIAKWEEDAIFTKDVSSETLNIPKIHNFYYTNLLKARRALIEAKRELDDLELERTLYFTGKASDEVYKREPLNVNVPKGDIPLWLRADDRVRKQRRKVEDLEELQKILNEILEQINSRQFRLNTILASEKFRAGLNK